MPQITQDQAKKFLNKIKDKVAIIHHDDLDGFASGILLYDFCKNKNAEPKSFPMILTEDALKKILKKLKTFDTILIADIPPYFISKNFEKLKDKKILYIDHHQKDTEISDFIQELRAPSDKYIPASRTCQELTNEKQWLGVAGTVADIGYKYPENDEYINTFLKQNNLSLKQFEKQIVHPITALLIYFSENLPKAFEILKEIDNPSEIKEIKKYADTVETEIQTKIKEFETAREKIGETYFYYIKSKFKIKTIVATNIGLKHPEKITIFATPENNQTINLSFRNQSEKMDMNKMASETTRNLENANGGGHKRAAGGTIQTKDLNKFKQNIRDYTESNPIKQLSNHTYS